MTRVTVPAETHLTELPAEEARETAGGGLWEWLFGTPTTTFGGGSGGGGGATGTW